MNDRMISATCPALSVRHGAYVLLSHISSFNGRDELRYLAPHMAAAEEWMARNRYSDMRAEIVADPDPVILPSDIGRAA